MGNNLCSCLLTDDKEYDKESNREKDKCENDLSEKTNRSQITTMMNTNTNTVNMTKRSVYNSIIAKRDIGDEGEDAKEILIKNKLRVIIRVYKEYKNRKAMLLKQGSQFTLRLSNTESQSSLLPSLKSEIEYIGNKDNGRMDGFGILTWKRGDRKRATLIGSFRLDSAHGYGLFTSVDGIEYKGQFRINKANGYGIYKNINGEQCEGFWENNHQMKVGIETYLNRTTYKGEYHSGTKNGIGTCHWSDGSLYQGQWDNNSMSGFGIYYFKEGHKYKGQLKANSMDGYGEMEWKDGKMYIGNFKQNQKSDFGMLLMHNSKQRAYVGYWKNNTQYGLGKVLTPNSVKYAQWISGTRTMTVDKESFIALLNKQSNEKSRSYFSLDYNALVLFFSKCKYIND